jgi:hypothetical protein
LELEKEIFLEVPGQDENGIGIELDSFLRLIL